MLLGAKWLWVTDHASFYLRVSCSLHTKAFFIAQIAYWVHALPELYLQKAKKVTPQAISLDWVLNFTRPFLFPQLWTFHRIYYVLLYLRNVFPEFFSINRFLCFFFSGGFGQQDRLHQRQLGLRAHAVSAQVRNVFILQEENSSKQLIQAETDFSTCSNLFSESS